MAVIQGRAGELWLVRSGDGSTITKQACEVVTGTRYHVTDAAKRYLDPETTILVYDDDVLVTSGYKIEGGCHIVFDSAPAASVTVSGKYLTPAEVAYVQNWEITLNSDVYDITSLGDTAKKFMGSGLISWSGSFERFYEDDTFATYTVSNTTRLIGRFFEDHPGGLVWTGWIAPNNWTGTMPLELARETFGFDGVGTPVYTSDET